MSQKPGEKSPFRRFTPLLMAWNHQSNHRIMPWKGEKDPYRIWISEIILQQTRVEQGLDYYLRFIREFPDVTALATASDDRVFKLWEGLGYYSRCRNLIATARFIHSEKNGTFPDDYNSILELKGIGPYTAAAISSFAFNLPHAVVDGNVYRVLARVFGIDQPADQPAAKKMFAELATDLLDKKKPGIYNQAIMDFGATVCKPLSPLCPACPMQKICIAYKEKRVHQLPVKGKKTAIRKRWFYYINLQQGNKTAIRQRTGKDIWQQLYEFPLIETEKETASADILQLLESHYPELKGKLTERDTSDVFRHQLSHQLIMGKFISARVKAGVRIPSFLWVDKDELKGYAFPKVIVRYLAM